MKSKLLMLIGIFCLIHVCATSSAEDKPNVLWITGEDMSARWLGCYGNEQIQTPNFDKFASEGFLYSHCFAHAPVCASARSGWITGNEESRVGSGARTAWQQGRVFRGQGTGSGFWIQAIGDD